MLAGLANKHGFMERTCFTKSIDKQACVYYDKKEGAKTLDLTEDEDIR